MALKKETKSNHFIGNRQIHGQSPAAFFPLFTIQIVYTTEKTLLI